MSGDGETGQPDDLRTILVGGDALALRVCEELMRTAGHHVTVLAAVDEEFRARVEELGASCAAPSGDERVALDRAGVGDAHVLIALSDDDHANLRYALAARDMNDGVRIVLRQFNRTLGRKIATNLRDCSVISLSSLSAATFASAAVDPACFAGVQFPDFEGPLFGFSAHRADELSVTNRSPDEAEALIAGRIVARDGKTDFDRAGRLRADESLIVFRHVRPRHPTHRSARRAKPRPTPSSVLRAIRTLDPVVRQTLGVAATIVLFGTLYFSTTLGLDPLRAAYFVFATMTTTGYGDIAPKTALGEIVAVVLMASGLTFTGIFIAVLSSRFADARYRAVQGLRHVARRDHIVVCGAGNVGSRVIDELLRIGVAVVVVEVAPTPDIVQRSRERHFDLLTGDASKDATLDLCNLDEAMAVVAITNSDTMNLEIALGARARNARLPIVMRVGDGLFEKALRHHFGFRRTFATAELAAPVFAGLSRAPGLRGRLTIERRPYSIVEFTAATAPHVPPDRACVLLGVARDGHFVPCHSFEQLQPGERGLMLYPLWRYRRDVDASPVAGTKATT